MMTRDASPFPRERFLFLAMPVLLVGILTDQASKSWAAIRATEPCALVPGYLLAYSVPNPGSILGLGRDEARTNVILALLGIVLATLLIRIAHVAWGELKGTYCLAGAMVLAGIHGNTVDRLALGHVRDFLIPWAIPIVAFNVADLLLVVGSACLFLARYCDRRRAQSDLVVAFPASA